MRVIRATCQFWQHATLVSGDKAAVLKEHPSAGCVTIPTLGSYAPMRMYFGAGPARPAALCAPCRICGLRRGV